MNWKKLIASSVYFILPLLLLFCLEWGNREGIEAAFLWMLKYPMRFFLTYLIILVIQTVFFIFTKNVYIVCLSNIAFFIVWFVIDANKNDILNYPLLPWDLFFIKQLMNLMPVIYKELNILVLLVAVLIFIALIILLAKKASTITIKLKLRIPLVIVSIAIMLMVGFSKHNLVGKFFEANNIAVLDWDQNLNQELNGIVLGFMLNMGSVFIDKPKQYNENTINDIKTAIQNNSEKIDSEQVKPNIIMIMSEAFWDIGKINNQLANENYIPTVQQYQVGNIASPQFGGGTANVEFEVLTGLSMNLLPAGSIPYQQYIKKETPSIASYLLQEGYSTTAIHTYFKWFWDRENVYKHLGFEKFISVAEMPDAQNRGYYIGDNEVTRQILQEVEETKDPVFIYAVTMQNHGSYNDNRYGDGTIQAPGEYEEDTQNSINTYVTGLVEADLELKRLIQYFEQSNEPTILVFFGDHLPLLGANYKSYIETGYLESEKNWTLQDTLKMKETPLVIWNNFDSDIEHVNSISPAFLVSKVLNLANFNQPELFQYLDEFSKSLPVYTNTIIQDSKGKLFDKTPKEYLEMENIYRHLQYDILFGNQYIYKK